ncbi:MAG: hypothetical protein ACPLSY_03360 [Moorellaceae bacterium]
MARDGMALAADPRSAVAKLGERRPRELGRVDARDPARGYCFRGVVGRGL